MPLTQNGQKLMLDWLLGGAAATRPSARWLQFATGTPNVSGASDGPFTPRITCSFAAAASPQGSASNRLAMTCTATAIATVLGWNIYDASVGGNRLAFGTMASSVGCASADTMAFAAASLKISLA